MIGHGNAPCPSAVIARPPSVAYHSAMQPKQAAPIDLNTPSSCFDQPLDVAQKQGQGSRSQRWLQRRSPTDFEIAIRDNEPPNDVVSNWHLTTGRSEQAQHRQQHMSGTQVDQNPLVAGVLIWIAHKPSCKTKGHRKSLASNNKQVWKCPGTHWVLCITSIHRNHTVDNGRQKACRRNAPADCSQHQQANRQVPFRPRIL